ncbi:hypothetical protein AB0O67_04990 [Streptomyces sp. NPDC086077]|uniref:hypothetical protein n=1 Tax=Streptomyces sp. NPDC086077 TaxID=3154862 RepID=UPI003445C95D
MCRVEPGLLRKLRPPLLHGGGLFSGWVMAWLAAQFTARIHSSRIGSYLSRADRYGRPPTIFKGGAGSTAAADGAAPEGGEGANRPAKRLARRLDELVLVEDLDHGSSGADVDLAADQLPRHRVDGAADRTGTANWALPAFVLRSSCRTVRVESCETNDDPALLES